MAKINVSDKAISVYTANEEDYICIKDITKFKDTSERTILSKTGSVIEIR